MFYLNARIYTPPATAKQSHESTVYRCGQKWLSLEVVTKQAQNRIYGFVWYGAPCLIWYGAPCCLEGFWRSIRTNWHPASSLLQQETSCPRAEEGHLAIRIVGIALRLWPKSESSEDETAFTSAWRTAATSKLQWRWCIFEASTGSQAVNR